MRFTLIIPEIVEEEIDEASVYYNKKQEGLGNKLYEDVTSTLIFLEKNPLSFQKSRRDYRHALLKKFPYLVIYKVYKDKILIFRFINARKHPVKRYK
jgi:hypothetical protein